MMALKNIKKNELDERIAYISSGSKEYCEYLKSLLNFEISGFHDEEYEKSELYFDILQYNIYYGIIKIYKELVENFDIQGMSDRTSFSFDEIKIFFNRLYPEGITGKLLPFPAFFFSRINGEIDLRIYDAYHDPDDFCGKLRDKDFKNIAFHQEVLNYFNEAFFELFKIKKHNFYLEKSSYFDERVSELTQLHKLDLCKKITLERVVQRLD